MRQGPERRNQADNRPTCNTGLYGDEPLLLEDPESFTECPAARTKDLLLLPFSREPVTNLEFSLKYGLLDLIDDILKYSALFDLL